MTAFWLDTVRERLGAGAGLVSVIVATAEGSAPREPGAWMLVDGAGQAGTIGGGRLEWEAAQTARAMLAAPAGRWQRDLRDYPLGPDLEQCCGGFVRLFYERIGPEELAGLQTDAPAGGLFLHPVLSGASMEFVADRRAAKALPLPAAKTATEMLSGQAPRATVLTPARTSGDERWLIHPVEPPGKPLYLYGAGHVGRAIVRALDGLPFAVTWIDTDEARFPPDVPGGVRRLATRDPAGIAAAAPDGAFHLVLTYSHAMDYDICHALLAGQPIRLRRADRLRDEACPVLQAVPRCRARRAGARPADLPHRRSGHPRQGARDHCRHGRGAASLSTLRRGRPKRGG